MESVYLETTIVSYLTASPARDVLVAANQLLTRQWWTEARPQFDCFISDAVLQEAGAGDPAAAAKRLAALHGVPKLPPDEDVESLNRDFLTTGIFPATAVRDATHLAFATAHGLDYLLTWNCQHLANARLWRRFDELASRRGFHLPRICTPAELLGELPHDE
jgi:hypothetical protein